MSTSMFRAVVAALAIAAAWPATAFAELPTKPELTLEAARRELYEETGMETVELIAEAPGWIDYDLPAHLVGVVWKGKYRGQTQKWFAFRFHGDESEIRINPPPGDHSPEFDRWDWRRMDELTGLIVPFKRKVYEQVIGAFRHLVG